MRRDAVREPRACLPDPVDIRSPNGPAIGTDAISALLVGGYENDIWPTVRHAFPPFILLFLTQT